jgi:hypothetical protein
MAQREQCVHGLPPWLREEGAWSMIYRRRRGAGCRLRGVQGHRLRRCLLAPDGWDWRRVVGGAARDGRTSEVMGRDWGLGESGERDWSSDSRAAAQGKGQGRAGVGVHGVRWAAGPANRFGRWLVLARERLTSRLELAQ